MGTLYGWWSVESWRRNQQKHEYPPDIMALLQKHQKVFGDIPLGRL